LKPRQKLVPSNDNEDEYADSGARNDGDLSDDASDRILTELLKEEEVADAAEAEERGMQAGWRIESTREGLGGGECDERKRFERADSQVGIPRLYAVTSAQCNSKLYVDPVWFEGMRRVDGRAGIK